jgi:multiple sugar transport system substrate-binding protein
MSAPAALLALIMSMLAACAPSATTTPAATTNAAAATQAAATDAGTAQEPAATQAAATDGAGAGAGVKQVRFANWWGEHEISIADEFFKKDFTPESNIEIVFDYSPFEGFIAKMISEIAAGNPADLILCNSDHVSSYASNGLMLPLDSYMERDGTDLTSFFGTSDWIIDEQLYGLPSWYGAWYFYVNVSMLEEAGIAVPRGSWTWDELRDVSLKVADPANGVYGLTDGMTPLYWYMLNGGGAFSDDMSACTINSDEVVGTLDYLKKLIFEDKVMPEYSAYGTTPPDQMFRDGKAAFHYNGTWTSNYLRENADAIDFTWDVIFAPNGPGAKGDVTPARSSGMFIPANGKDLETSWEVMKFWASVEGINNLDIGALSSMPPSQATLESEVYNLYPQKQPEHFSKEFFSAVAGRAKYFPYTHYMLNENVQNAMNSLTDALNSNLDSKTVCDQAYATIMDNWQSIVKVGQ